jgi:hypothetical protein
MRRRAVGEARLSPAARRSLASVAARLDPHALASGRAIADQLRAVFPDVGDETLSAILDAATFVGASMAAIYDCEHMKAYLDLLRATAAELAALDVPP